MKYNIDKYPVLQLLFIFAGVAFGLAMLKILLFSPVVGLWYYFVEFGALLLFLCVLFIADVSIRNYKKVVESLSKEKQDMTEIWRKEKEALLKRLSYFEERDNEIKRFASYQEKMMRRIFDEGHVAKDGSHFLHLLAEVFQASAAILYKESEPNGQFVVQATYAVSEDFHPEPFSVGEGFNGQAAADKAPMVIDDIPEAFLSVSSGLGELPASVLYLLPVVKEGHCTYLIEMASFKKNEIERMWNDLSARMVEEGIL
ncbi:hypothetical protein ACT3CD_00820 [Geofilum sp. OHC36d9]|uniref:hypothetical protein n=1 Tax=Geofilum sp. OHC36d9 TaxID=3458413 RepID=UPI0040345D52